MQFSISFIDPWIVCTNFISQMFFFCILGCNYNIWYMQFRICLICWTFTLLQFILQFSVPAILAAETNHGTKLCVSIPAILFHHSCNSNLFLWSFCKLVIIY
jgi:hypothetical protein